MGHVRMEVPKPIPSAEYPAVVKEVKEGIQTKFGPKLSVTFLITQGVESGRTANKLFSEKLTPASDLAALCRTLEIPLPEDGQLLDLDVLKGRPVIVTVEAKTDKNGNLFNNVTAWRRLVPLAPGTSIAPVGYVPVQPPMVGYVPNVAHAPAPVPVPMPMPPPAPQAPTIPVTPGYVRPQF